MSTHQTSTDKPRNKRGRKTLIYAAAFLLVGALVVQATIAPLDLSSKDSSSAKEEKLASNVLPPEAELRSSVPDLPSASQEIAATHARIESLVNEQEQLREQSTAEVVAWLESVLAIYSGLPAVPVDYVDGLPVEGVADTVSTIDLPILETTIALTSFVGTTWEGIPNIDPSHPGVVPGVSSGEVQGALDEVNAILADLLEGDEIQEVIRSLEDVTGPTPVGPLPIGAPESSDVDGTVEPHEEGAQAALGHATSLLGTADGAFDTLDSQAQLIIDTQSDLVAELESVIDETQATVTVTTDDILDQATERALNALEQVAYKQEQLQLQLSGYEAHLESALTRATQDIQQAVADQEAALTAGLETEIAALEALALQTEVEADANLRQVTSEAQRILAELKTTGATEAELDELFATVGELRAEITSESEQSIALLNAEVAELQGLAGELTGSLDGVGDDALGQVTDIADSASEEAIYRLGYALDFVAASAQATAEAHQAEAMRAISDLNVLAQHETNQLLELTYDTVFMVSERLDTALGLVEDVQGEVYETVSFDLDYIFKVAEDYNKAPVGERADQAEHWFGVHALVGGDLGGVLLDGDGAYSVVDDAMELTELNLAQLTAMIPA